ncbi:MAG TPA: LON peptidase substrate-binding domain-containing protein [Gemmatimonadales bacterium]|nr:LON peptidase substrate-binding domain-containing protein [Gemmatimonadales bacterium]
MPPHQLPLFPLQVVLFPGAMIPLYIFEPRYRQLLADVSAGDRRFGILPPGVDGGLPDPGAVGCSAMLRGVQALPDGCANIVVSGEERFRFLGAVASDSPYHRGLVEPFGDEVEVQVPSEAELRRLRALAERYAAALESRNDQFLELQFSLVPGTLTFQAAALLEWSFEDRQRVLESRSLRERVTLLLHALPALVQTAEQRARIHGQSKQNGHGALR